MIIHYKQNIEMVTDLVSNPYQSLFFVISDSSWFISESMIKLVTDSMIKSVLDLVTNLITNLFVV